MSYQLTDANKHYIPNNDKLTFKFVIREEVESMCNILGINSNDWPIEKLKALENKIKRFLPINLLTPKTVPSGTATEHDKIRAVKLTFIESQTISKTSESKLIINPRDKFRVSVINCI